MQIPTKGPIGILSLIIMATALLTTIMTTNSLIPIARAQNTNATNATINTNQMLSANSTNKTFYLFTVEKVGPATIK